MRVVALSGGIGGAKLALGLQRVLAAGALTVIANTGDDFEHLGLHVSPDIDTLAYTLSGLADPVRGWGRADESWNFMAALAELGGETWFQLGDRDLAMHVRRSAWLRGGGTLSGFTDLARRRLGVPSRLLPATDDAVRTRVRTADGWLDFQRYFVGLRCAPALREIGFEGAPAARPAPGVAEALAGADVIVICPSNPYLSIDSILAVPGLREALRRARAPRVAVSPIIGGQAVKGPTAKIMAELGVDVSAASVARHYAGLIDVFVVDAADRGCVVPDGVRRVAAEVLMQSLPDRERLARAVLAAAGMGVAP